MFHTCRNHQGRYGLDGGVRGWGGFCIELLSGKHRQEAPPGLFSPLFSFDDHLQLNFKALLEEAPALTVVLRDEQVQTDVSAAF